MTPRSPLSVLARNRDFRNLFVAELVMLGGDWFVMIPLLALLPELTGRGLWGGLVLAADPGVSALLLPYAGTVADRFDRRRIVLVANLVGVVAVAALLLVRSAGTAWIALAGVAVLSAAKTCYAPAASAALPNLVEPADLADANAVSGSAWGTMLVVGASLGGVMTWAVGPYPCFVIDGACLLVATGLLWRVRGPMQAAADARGPVRARDAFGEALRYIGHRPRIAALITVKSGVGLGNGVLTAFPLLATVAFGVGPLGTGALFAARGAGVLFGPLLLRRVLSRPGRLLAALAGSMAVYGLAYLGVAASPWFALVVPLVVIAHVGGGANWAMSNYGLQSEVPDALRGRVLATDLTVATLSVAVSQLGAGALIDHTDPRVVVAICGGVSVAYAAGWYLAARRTSMVISL